MPRDGFGCGSVPLRYETGPIKPAAGADNGNRTRLVGLGSRSSTDKLCPHISPIYYNSKPCLCQQLFFDRLRVSAVYAYIAPFSPRNAGKMARGIRYNLQRLPTSRGTRAQLRCPLPTVKPRRSASTSGRTAARYRSFRRTF